MLYQVKICKTNHFFILNSEQSSELCFLMWLCGSNYLIILYGCNWRFKFYSCDVYLNGWEITSASVTLMAEEGAKGEVEDSPRTEAL